MTRIIDSHLDLSWVAVQWGRDLNASLDAINQAEQGMTDELGRGRATTCFPEMRRAEVAVCLGTLLVRAPRDYKSPKEGQLRVRLDNPLPEIAAAVARGQLAYYHDMQRLGRLRMIATAAELNDHWAKWSPRDDAPIGVILAMEGADPITSPDQLERWWNDGLRSLGLTHYGHGQYGDGTGREGPLLPAAYELLREMQRVGMILDLTHLSDKGFFQALDHFDGPVLASHNNCRALVPGDRQFSDEQIRRLLERDAVIGVAFDAWMLHPGWKRGVTDRNVVNISAAVDHIDHICQLAGDCAHVAIGSDLDGGFGTEQTPKGLDTIADLHKLVPTLRERGYSEQDVDNIFHGNWLRYFQKHLPD